MRAFSADAEAISLMQRQHGCALVSQLNEVGLSRGQIALRVRHGLFERLARGVVGLKDREVTPHGRAMRAVLIARPNAVACRWTAAELLGLDAPRSMVAHVVVEGCRRQNPTDDVHVHRTRQLPPHHVIASRSVPTTSLPRTIVDCSTELDAWSALRLLDSCSASPSMWRAIHSTADALSNGRAGVRAIAEATHPDGADRLRSVLERFAAEALRVAGMPPGEWNVAISDRRGWVREVDLCFRQQCLIVEFDGLRHHEQRATAQRDRATDRRLQLAGWTIMRFTWRDVTERPTAMVAEIREALRA